MAINFIKKGIDTSDANATASDIAQNKTAYVNGEKITGTVVTVESGEQKWFGIPANFTEDETKIILPPTDLGTYYRAGAIHYFLKSNLRNRFGITADKIVSGNTILGVEGTATTGTDTSDATAIAGDIASGKTAYVNGEKVTGSIYTLGSTSGTTVDANGSAINLADYNGGTIRVSHSFSDKDWLIRQNGSVYYDIKYSKIRNAIGLTGEQIKSGETILGVEGTYEGDNINDYIDVPAETDTLTIQSCIKQIPLIDTSNVTSMQGMFYDCTSLTTIPLLNTSNVEDMIDMFNGCTSLTTIPLIDTSNVTSISSMFDGCKALTTIPLLDISSAEETNNMFYNCTSLTTIPQLDTSSAFDMSSMFRNCTALVTVPQLNMNNADSITNIFANCNSLSNDSLNNILASLLTATSYSGTKTLARIGLSSTQATTCTTLSNWTACETAGWTTGY